MSPKPEKISKDGSSIYRHKASEGPLDPAFGDPKLIEAIEAHVEKHVGPIKTVFHEIVSDKVHIDVLFCEPTSERPYHSLVSCGMSARAMNAPATAQDRRYAELVLALPAEWNLNQDAFSDDANYWPIRWIKTLARLPHEYDTWLSFGHTIPNGDPPQPFHSHTKLSGWILLAPFMYPEAFATMPMTKKDSLTFYSMLPLYTAEMQFKLDKGAQALGDKLADIEISGVIDLKRKNAVSKGGFWPFKK